MHHATDKPDMPAFQALQHKFTSRVRDPQHQPLPDGVSAERMAVYEELIFNNIESLLSAAFPVTRQLHEEEEWLERVRHFIAQYHAHTPYFTRLPEEFLDYLKAREEVLQQRPFLLELAHYEWLELALSVAELPELPPYDPAGDLRCGRPLLSPLAWLHDYHYPVHRIGPYFQPEQAPEQDTHLLLYRDHNDTIGFIELSPISAHLVRALQSKPQQTGEAQLRAVAELIQHPKPNTVINGGLQILEELRSRGVVLGALVEEEAGHAD